MVLNSEKLAIQIAYWTEGSESDFQTAEKIITSTDRYAAGLFFLHLAVEKALKARVVKKTKEHAPYTHNLLHLLTKLEVSSPKDIVTLLGEINDFNLEARYPDVKREFEKLATKEFAHKYLLEGKKVLKWISQN